MSDEWKNIPGFEGWYKIKEDGTVKRMERVVIYPDGHEQTYKEKIIKPHVDSCGYLSVSLSKNGKKKDIRIHLLLMRTFRPIKNERELKLVVDHINRNRLDNRLENLRWTTQTVNVKNGNLKFRPDIHKVNGGFQVRFSIHGVRKHIGFVHSYEDALSLYTEHFKRRAEEYNRLYQ